MTDNTAISISEEDIELVLKGMEDLQKMHNQSFPLYLYYSKKSDVGKDEILKILKSKDKYLLKLSHQKELTGFIFYRKNQTNGEIKIDNVFIESIYIFPKFRNNGYAVKLFSATELYFKEHGIFNFSLNVWNFNTSAINLYEKLGFKPVRTYLTKGIEQH